ncbi:MAG: uracil-DNA glycosylase [Elusimicrobia bacterium]|nr:uracil-DNA glycosylase [Elusimicrobiota bacterium]
MTQELKEIAQGLKAFLLNAEEDEIILKAALNKEKAAFNSNESRGEETSHKSEEASLSGETAYAVRNAPQEKTRNAPVEIMTKSTDKKETLTSDAPIDKAEELAHIAELITNCQRCDLGKTRIKPVPGEGNINAKIMFVGEGPGYEEDRQGRPFVGRAGQLLDKIIAAMGFSREEVFIANIVKCHPMIDPTNPDKRSNDRAPKSDEIAVCRRYLEQQIKTVSPDYVVALGGVAAKTLISEVQPFGSIRGKILDLKLSCVTLDKPVKIMATFHPAALLRNPGWKKDAWQNLKVLLADMGRQPASK